MTHELYSLTEKLEEVVPGQPWPQRREDVGSVPLGEVAKWTLTCQTIANAPLVPLLAWLPGPLHVRAAPYLGSRGFSFSPR